MKEIEVKDLRENMITAIGHEWMLVTAGKPGDYNTMTASWGGVGQLWGQPVAFVFVRPERYTHDFIERSDGLTLSFLGEEGRGILNYCGSHSGRDADKAAATGLVPVATPDGRVAFEQARLTLEGRKLYCYRMSEADFIDRSLLEKWYSPARGSLHDVYVVSIDHVYVR